MSVDLWAMGNVANIQCCRVPISIPMRVSDVGSSINWSYEEGVEICAMQILLGK